MAISLYLITAISIAPSNNQLFVILAFYIAIFLIPMINTTYLISNIRSLQQIIQRRLIKLLNCMNSHNSTLLLSQPQRFSYLEIVSTEMDEPISAWQMFTINRSLLLHFFNINASVIVMVMNLVGDEVYEFSNLLPNRKILPFE